MRYTTWGDGSPRFLPNRKDLYSYLEETMGIRNVRIYQNP